MTRPTVTTRLKGTTDTGHLIEYLYDDDANEGVLACAAHGGRIEPGTAEQAIELAAHLSPASCWACLGYDDDAKEFEQWHPPSTAFDPDAYPLLGEIAGRGFETVISFHGLGEDGLLVGGGIDDATKRLVRDRLDEAVSPDVGLADGTQYAGTHPDNFVNWLARGDRGGLQLEQSRDCRDHEGELVVEVLTDLITAGDL